MRRHALLALPLMLGLLAGPALGVGLPSEMLPDPAQEQRARSIGHELRCMVCQNQSIEESEADLARDLRRIVRERVAAGDSDSQVVSYLHDRYGDFVLLRPPFTFATAALWGAPFIALGGGLLAILLLRRRRIDPVAAAPLSAEEQARLAALEDGAAR
ncbi:cytochrome c-type biogenesis protein CcmH [Pseudoroseomonas wenyumeiae]|uniref:Cytochrome c-type biogenesis protein n=1 Tax=Teichococcus wenyumeiae TaxID=2478470 RepID=A0A3A9JRR9_9PROT|nr:cytochrome c-type biogenesis protein [Pseudoroseomonas wenyumeiae]RKK03378.1 cytochrome c-type biogenesis protein CcmH [Pseudoroseomonas wenyumeiae]RMI27286.1 cytochrome c-type biogenesis protein CcmH [Pseudoroseomonas wenyumeiae]